MAPPTVATVAPVIPPPGIAIPQTLTRPPAIIQPIPGQPVVIPPPAVVAPTIVGTPVVNILSMYIQINIHKLSILITKKLYLLDTGYNNREFRHYETSAGASGSSETTRGITEEAIRGNGTANVAATGKYVDQRPERTSSRYAKAYA